MHTLLYIKQITSKDLLYHTGNKVAAKHKSDVCACVCTHTHKKHAGYIYKES